MDQKDHTHSASHSHPDFPGYDPSNPLTGEQPNRLSFGMSRFEEDEAPKTFYRESTMSWGELRQQRMSLGASRRESLLFSPSPSKSGRGLKLNLTSMFDTAENDIVCTPIHCGKVQRRDARNSLEISPFFQGHRDSTPIPKGRRDRSRSNSCTPTGPILFGLFDRDRESLDSKDR